MRRESEDPMSRGRKVVLLDVRPRILSMSVLQGLKKQLKMPDLK